MRFRSAPKRDNGVTLPVEDEPALLRWPRQVVLGDRPFTRDVIALSSARSPSRWPVEHHFEALVYPDDGHGVGPVPHLPATGSRTFEHSLTGQRMDVGGNPVAAAAARADSWLRVLAFLAEEVPGGGG